MRAVKVHLFAASLALAVAACRSSGTSVESGALLLALAVEPGAAAPDELRISVYDDTGVLWREARVPDAGALVPESASRLGTVLVQPGASSGNVRLHVRGLLAGARTLDALLVVTPAERARGTFALTLEAGAPADGDGDGVPDQIDDCPGTANGDQHGCPGTGGAGGEGGSGGGVGGGGGAAAGGAGGGGSTAGAGGSGGPDDGGADADPCGAAGCSRPLGAACSNELQCGSGFCVDGVCCASACTGPCRSCNQPGSDGMCLAYAQGSDPNRECATGLTCNGVGSCGPPPAGSKQRGELCGAAGECASGHCVDGVCCSTACTDACRTCATGTCVEVRRAEDAPECVAPMTCNPSARCVAQ